MTPDTGWLKKLLHDVSPIESKGEIFHAFRRAGLPRPVKIIKARRNGFYLYRESSAQPGLKRLGRFLSGKSEMADLILEALDKGEA